MHQINNEKFGLLVTELRKEKNMTQKELAEKLYVSDKTVSKWERGLSMPNIVLLMPIAEIFGITVTELLRGEKSNEPKNDLCVRNSIRQHKKNWILAYLVCFLIVIVEISILVVSGISLVEMKDNVLMVTGLMLIFGGWFCIFAKDLLPTYYDENKLNYVSQGIFKMHMVGLSFHNGNWTYICTTLKMWTLVTAILYPLICIFVINLFDLQLWNAIKDILVWVAISGMIASIYIVGKKYN